MRIELLPKIDVKNAQRVCRCLRDQVLNRSPRGLATLSEAAKADCIRAASNRDGLIGHSYAIPRHICFNREMGKPIARQRDLRSSRRRRFIDLHGSFRQTHLMKAANDFTPVVIVPNARDDLSLRAQGVRVIGEVRGRSPQLWSSEKQVPEHFSHADNVKVHGLFDAQLFLDLLQRHALGFRNHRLYPNELQNHHAGKEREDVTGWESGDHLWEKSRQQGGENPVREAAERLAFGAMTVGKYFGDEYPNDRSLTDRVRGDKGENTNRHDREMLSKESPGNQTERSDVAERSNKKKRAATQPVNEPEADKSEHEISDADADGLEQRRFRSQPGKFKYARREIENRIDAGELVEKRNQDGKQDRFAQT